MPLDRILADVCRSILFCRAGCFLLQKIISSVPVEVPGYKPAGRVITHSSQSLKKICSLSLFSFAPDQSSRRHQHSRPSILIELIQRFFNKYPVEYTVFLLNRSSRTSSLSQNSPLFLPLGTSIKTKSKSSPGPSGGSKRFLHSIFPFGIPVSHNRILAILQKISSLSAP